MREQLASLLSQPQVRWLSTVPAEARVELPEVQLAAAMSLAPAETPKQPQECSQRTPQPQHLRDQPKGHSVRQQQELEEPSPPHMDWSRSQGEEDAMHNSRRAEPQDETAAGVRAMPPTNAVRGRRRTGQAAEVEEALMPSPTDEDPPAARNGRPTTSGMSAGATAATADGPVAPLPGESAPMKAEARVPHPADLLALQVPSQWILEAAAATSRDQAEGTAGSVAQWELQPSGKEEGGDEPPLGGLWKGADETGQQGEHTRPCGANQSAKERKATSATHPDELKLGTNPAAVATTQRQEEARREAGAEKLPERGSPVEVQQTLHQEEAGREAGAKKLPERGSPVEVQQMLHQEETGREAGT